MTYSTRRTILCCISIVWVGFTIVGCNSRLLTKRLEFVASSEEWELHEFYHLCRFHLDAPCGIEYLPGSRTNGTHIDGSSFRFEKRNATVRDVLDAISNRHPDYRWTVKNGVINMSPKSEGSSVLNRPIDRLDIDSIWTNDVAPLILRVAGLRIAPTAMAGVRFDAPRISLHLRNVTVGEALNRAVKSEGRGMWIVMPLEGTDEYVCYVAGWEKPRKLSQEELRESERFRQLYEQGEREEPVPPQ